MSDVFTFEVTGYEHGLTFTELGTSVSVTIGRDATLDHLHQAIHLQLLDADMGVMPIEHDGGPHSIADANDHLYAFWPNGEFAGDGYCDPRLLEGPGPADRAFGRDWTATTNTTRLASLIVEPGQQLSYEWDFGDSLLVVLTARRVPS